ncbi:glycosyltransferase [Aerococcus urinaeequi]|uniref:glycosyltransferase n=1 Tax=Aerococcus urinaeequi TaxID=51665 RepID=UPI003D6B52BF
MMKKKLLFMIPSLGGGGAERVLVNLVNNLNPDKFDITVYCLFDGGNNRKYLNDYIMYKFFFKRAFRGNIHLLKLFSPEFLFRNLVKQDYDVIVSYLEGPTTRIIGGYKGKDTKLIGWVHTGDSDKNEYLKSYRSEEELTNIYNRYDSIIFVSQSARKIFENHFKNITTKKLIKYNSVEDKKIREESNEPIEDLEMTDTNFNIISVGKYTKIKGYKRLINIVNQLTEIQPNIHLFLIGEGELKSDYKKLIRSKGLENHITLLGYKNNPYKYVKKADLFVCSSYQEGFSTAVTESLIVGTPVISTFCSGMTELLGEHNEYGIITDNNEESLLHGIETLLLNNDLLEHYSNQAANRSKKFSLEDTVCEVEKLIDTNS